MVYSKQVGARVKRKEDPRLITGSSTYVDDVQARNVAHLAILRSTYAHAKINRIDTSRARQLPGVVAVYTGADFKPLTGPMPFGGGEGSGGLEGQVTIHTNPLEADRVRHVGQAIGVVVAESPAIARDALDLIEVDYEPLPVLVDMEAADKPGAPQIYDNVPNNIGYVWTKKTGDVARAFAEADAVVSQRMNNQRLSSISMETRGAFAQPDPIGDGLIVYTSTQNPHRHAPVRSARRDAVAAATRRGGRMAAAIEAARPEWRRRRR